MQFKSIAWKTVNISPKYQESSMFKVKVVATTNRKLKM